MKEVNPKFLTTLAVIFLVVIGAVFTNAIVTLQKRVTNLEMRPIAVLPTPREAATPSATLTVAPTKAVYKIVPTKQP
jgi:hypothetical protein